MSTALYNRYRPATFAQVVGQEHVTDALGHALRSGRLHHAYLFSGPRGCGKTSSARILAASLNCEKGPTPEPCGVCDQCVSIRTGSSMDVTEIDAASHGLVDDARDLRERAFFAPASARFKVFVVDEAHMVTAAAFNALLKVVEEPPPYLKFVFATTEPDKVIATIRSRTHHYAFRLVPPGVLRNHLESICEQEGVVVDPAVLPLVVRAGAGSVRDSLSVLDQLLAGAGEGGLSYERAVALLGMTDGILLDETVDALAERDGAALFTVVDRVVSSGHDPRRFATDLLDRLRDLIVVAAVPDAAERGLLESFSSDQVDRMRAQAGRIGPVELSRTADVLHTGLVEMRGTASPRLLLELILARALLPGAAADPAALAVRLERLERRPAPAPAGAAAPAGPAGVDGAREYAGGPHSPGAADGAPVPARAAYVPQGQPSAPAPLPAAGGPPSQPVASMAPRGRGPVPAAGVGGLDAAGLAAVWEEVLAFAGRRSRRTHAILKDYASVTEVRGDEVVIAFSAPAMAKMFGQGNNIEILAAAIADRFGGSWRITIGGGGPGPSGGRPQPPPGGAGGTGRPAAGGPGRSSGPDFHGGPGGQGAPAPVEYGNGNGNGSGPGYMSQMAAVGQPGGGSPGGPYNGAVSSPAVPVPVPVPGNGDGPGGPTNGVGSASGWSGPVTDQAGGGGGPRAHTAMPPTPTVADTSAAVGVPGTGGVQTAGPRTVVRAGAVVTAGGPPAPGPGMGQVPGQGAAPEAGPGPMQEAGVRPGGGGGGGGAAAARAAVMTARAGQGTPGRGPGSATASAATGVGHRVAGGATVAGAVGDTPVVDEVSLDDEDAPTHLGGARGGEEAAMALLRTSLGATVIEQAG
ncbi:DNA polymerase III subunit gamma and tau [Parafrankia elaeagni]|uniref:DNA polymerase III subunit gamma and tau n=1 Tax=Parafrankia elaeagni TaxID=222534 RepID=UPI000370D503|nr:DNA polymerase III subunit gamma and tau [Parafrankia elaeagni]